MLNYYNINIIIW